MRPPTHIGLIGLLILGLLWGLWGCGEDRPAEEAAEQYLSLWQEAEHEDMYALLSSSAQEMYDQEHFSYKHESIFRTLRGYALEYYIETEEISEDEDGDGVTLPFSINIHTHTVGEIAVENSMRLIQDDAGEWRVDWEPELIFPELSGDRVVRVSRKTPKRGRILDRHGNPLAHYQQRSEVFVVPGNYEDEEELVQDLSPLIGMGEEAIQRKLGQGWVREGLMVPLKVLSLKEEARLDNIIEIAGVGARSVEVRTYPQGDAFSPAMGYLSEVTAEDLEDLWAVGYVAGDMVGRSGLEKALEERLRGAYGFTATINEPDGERVAVIGERGAEDGEDIKLTLDLELQLQAIDALGDKNGAVVVLNADTGEVLVLASQPSFDPNSFISGISYEEWSRLQADPDGPFRNRALLAAFPPGSAYKPLTAVFALEEGIIAPDEGMDIQGKRWQPDASWGDFYIERLFELAEPVDMRDALMYSDNIYFARLALELGEEAFRQANESVGFGQRIPFTLSVSRSRMNGDSPLSDVELAVSGFGQGRLMNSPLHLGLMYSALVRGGKMPMPLLLSEDEPETWKAGLFSGSNAELISGMLVANLEDPRSPLHHGRIDGAVVGGKTGTAQTDAIEGNVCWYGTYAMGEMDPLVVVAMVEGGDWASRVALPIGRDILAQALDVMGR